MNEIEQQGVDLLAIMHRSMDWDVWGSKRLKYWDVFQENVAAAAYTNSLAKWLDRFCNRMSVTTPGRNDADRTALNAILNGGQDKLMLKCLREETQLVVLAVRVAQQEKKEQAQAAQAKMEQMELDALNTQTGQPVEGEIET